jgi:hypothetical protein
MHAHHARAQCPSSQVSVAFEQHLLQAATAHAILTSANEVRLIMMIFDASD